MVNVTGFLAVNAEKMADGSFVLNLSNGSKIVAQEKPEYNGNTWAWKIDTQIFEDDEYAMLYLRKLISEKLTGYRVILHAKREVPDICGVEGRACRHPGKCNTMLCQECPVAEAFFAEKDDVTLIYAFSKNIKE